jgi:hypothetical protein
MSTVHWNIDITNDQQSEWETSCEKLERPKNDINRKTHHCGISRAQNAPTMIAVTNWKHPSDLSRGRAFLWTAPSQRVYHLLTYAISNAILKSSPRLASTRRARLGPFFPFPHPPTPVLSPYILYLPNPSPVEEDRWKGGFIRPVHRPSPRGAVDVKSPASMHPVDYRANPLVFYL